MYTSPHMHRLHRHTRPHSTAVKYQLLLALHTRGSNTDRADKEPPWVTRSLKESFLRLPLKLRGSKHPPPQKPRTAVLGKGHVSGSKAAPRPRCGWSLTHRVAVAGGGAVPGAGGQLSAAHQRQHGGHGLCQAGGGGGRGRTGYVCSLLPASQRQVRDAGALQHAAFCRVPTKKNSVPAKKNAGEMGVGRGLP